MPKKKQGLLRFSGEKLVKWRAKAGLSQEKLADAMREAGHPVLKQDIVAYEGSLEKTGRQRKPNADRLMAFSAVLGCEPADLCE